MTKMTEKLPALSLGEKVTLLSGADFWRTNALPDHEIPTVKVSDGPNGARGDFSETLTSACFPVGVALGATWDPELNYEIGQALANETKLKAAQVLLAPTINLQRTPVGGRNFECLSEDPLLTGEVATSIVSGLQDEGVGACPKHYVGNDTEFERMTISSDIDEQTLREVYLAPFEQIVSATKPWMIMAAYNRLNGVASCSQSQMINDILKSEWGFDGVVVSDWYAAQDTVGNALGGLDLEMPGPSRVWGDMLIEAVKRGDVSEQIIDDKVRRLLALMDKAELSDADEQSHDRPEDRALIRKAAAQSFVLLKNDAGRLPLSPADKRTVAVIGPNAAVGQIMGGGSSFVNSHPPVHPLEGLKTGLPACDFVYEPGCTNYKYIPLFDPKRVQIPNRDTCGFYKESFADDSFSGEAISGEIVMTSRLFLLETDGASAPAMRLTGDYTPEFEGPHIFGITSAGRARIYVDGELLVDNWNDTEIGDSFFGFGTTEKRGEIHLSPDRAYRIVVEYATAPVSLVAGVQFGVTPVLPDDAIDRAVTAAQAADDVILVVGSNGDWESEGHDRQSLDLPSNQNDLIEAVLDVAPHAIIVMNVGAVTAMPWYDRAESILVTWFPGQEMGNALADVITGRSEPTGRLPFTWPHQLSDHPAYAWYPGKDGHMPYKEGRLIGYRWYEKHGITPLAPFGFGLGYGEAQIVGASVIQDDVADYITAVDVEVKNTGSRDTTTVVQVYLEASNAHSESPSVTLAAFKKVQVAANTSFKLSLSVSKRPQQTWNVETKQWEKNSAVTGVRVAQSATDSGVKMSL